jgi:hypothetical protein
MENNAEDLKMKFNEIKDENLEFLELKVKKLIENIKIQNFMA